MTCVLVLGLLLLMTLSGDSLALRRRFGEVRRDVLSDGTEVLHIRPLVIEDEMVVEGGVLGFKIPSGEIRTFVVDSCLEGARPQWSSTNESAVRICDSYTNSVIIRTRMRGRAFLEVRVGSACVAVLVVIG